MPRKPKAQVPLVVAEPVVDITERALAPSPHVDEELKPKVFDCVEPGCTKKAMASDARCAKHSMFRRSAKAELERANAHFKRNAFTYARLHMKAAEIAAAQGDAKPSEWALLHTRAVEPVAKDSGGGGLVVNVGVVLPGLKEGV